MNREKKVSYELSDDKKNSIFNFGSPLNEEVYDPQKNQVISKTGGWAMIRRPLPAIENGLDEEVTVGRIFWVEHSEGADDEGFLPDGRYKVRCFSSKGDVYLWPYEYIILDTDYILSAWLEGFVTFHPTGVAESQLSDQLFYARSRGISLGDAMVMALGTISGPVGWFEPNEEMREFVTAFQETVSLTDENRARRAKAHAKKTSK